MPVWPGGKRDGGTTMDFAQFIETYRLQLDEQQAAAVQAPQRQILLLAVPGSGKTTVLVSRVGYLRHVLDVPPERILTMTYTVAATADMRRRYAAYFGEEEAAQLAFRTINGVCSRIIYHYQRLSTRPGFSLLDDGGRQGAILSEVYRAETGEFATESTIAALKQAITYAKNMMATDEMLAEMKVEGAAFGPLFRRYCAALRSQKLMDFDDQMVYALQILRRYPQILAAVQRQYTHFLVDEAQDTSKIQHLLLRLLAGDSGNLFLVGDEDQSIYGFRAAYPQALMEFPKVYPQGRVLYLERNYRSTREIVSAADRFIQKNKCRYPKRLVATRGCGVQVRAVDVENRRHQVLYLAKVAENPDMETAVLYRDNESALPLIDLLEQRGIPYRSRQVDSTFFSSRVVRDITDMLRFSLNPADGALFLNFYYKLGAGISRAAAHAAAESGGQSVLEVLAEMPGLAPYTRRQVKALKTHFSRLPTLPADKAIRRIVRYMGYGDYLEAQGMDESKTEILALLGIGRETPQALLTRLQELEEIVRRGTVDVESRLILSTIHSSKGLEYDRVILMDVADGLFPRSVPSPSSRDIAARDTFEEERRLFYVGMTRARQALWLMRFSDGHLVSTFVQEVMAQLPSAAIAASQADFPVGAFVHHQRFGSGVITARKSDVVTIAFEDGQVKKFLLSVSLQENQLTLRRS